VRLKASHVKVVWNVAGNGRSILPRQQHWRARVLEICNAEVIVDGSSRVENGDYRVVAPANFAGMYSCNSFAQTPSFSLRHHHVVWGLVVVGVYRGARAHDSRLRVLLIHAYVCSRLTHTRAPDSRLRVPLLHVYACMLPVHAHARSWFTRTRDFGCWYSVSEHGWLCRYVPRSWRSTCVRLTLLRSQRWNVHHRIYACTIQRLNFGSAPRLKHRHLYRPRFLISPNVVRERTAPTA